MSEAMSDDMKEKMAAEERDLNKQIIGSIAKPYKGEQTSRWIKNLDDEALATEITNANPDQSLNLPSPQLLDRMFDEFQRYAYEYEQNVAKSGQRFPINIARPRPTDAPTTAQYGKVPILCRGHVSTARWAMIFIGMVGKIQAFIVPVEYSVGFQPAQSEYKPFVEMKSVADKNRNDWRIDEFSIAASTLPALTKRFFGSLIKVERGDIKHTDRFVMDPSAPVEEPPPPPRLKESDQVELLSDAVLQQEDARKRAFQQAGQATASGQYQQVQPQATASGQYQQLPSQSTASGQYQQPAQAQRYQQQQSGDGANDTLPEAFSRNASNVHGALSDLAARLDAEVDRLTKMGMMAVTAQDMVGAQQTIIRSAKLKEMRERVNDLSNEWNSVAH